MRAKSKTEKAGATMKKKVFFGIVSIVLLYLVWAAGNVGLGCSINQGLLMCGSKEKRLEGCYTEVK